MRGLVALPLALLACACSSAPVVAEGPLQPRSYATFTGSEDHGVGVLRRLAVPPAHSRFFHDGERVAEMEEQDARSLHEWAVAFVRDWRDYEAVPVGDAGSDVVALQEWAIAAEVGDAPDARVREAVREIGARTGADAVLVLSSLRRPPSTWNFATALATGLLSAPLLMIESEGLVQVDVVEIATGRVVWRSVRDGVDCAGGVIGDFTPLHHRFVREALEPLDHAVPEILTEPAGARAAPSD